MPTRRGPLLTAIALLLLLLAPAARAAVRASTVATYSDAIRVELRGSSTTGGVPIYTVTAGNPDRYATFRRGGRIEYVLSHLPGAPGDRYDLELSFAQPISSCPGSDVFDVGYAAADSSPTLPALTALNLCTAGNSLGSVRGLSVRIVGVTSAARQIRFTLSAQSGAASLSWIRIGPQGSLDDGSAAQLTPVASRANPGAINPDHASFARLTDFSKLRVHETALSRFGARTFVSAAPQRFGWRQGALGTDATEISEFVVLVKRGGVTRAMPFTDRYPIFDSVDQSDRATGFVFSATDPVLGINADFSLTSPFWPQDESATTLPAFYAEITLTNPSGTPVTDAEVTVARPYADDAQTGCGACAPRPVVTPELTGVIWSGDTATGASSRPDPGEHYGSITARQDEGLALAAADSAETEISTSIAISSAVSTPGYREQFSFEKQPLGFAGFRWRPSSVPASSSATKSFLMPSYVAGKVFEAAPPSYGATDYSFGYASRYPDITSVAVSAVGLRGDQLAKAAAFDRALALPSDAATRDLLTLAFRSYSLNAWMLDRISGAGPDHWYNEWEGSTPCCRFNSTVDVAYNDSELLLALWPGLLDRLLEEWRLYAGSTPVIPHDTGELQVAGGQSYFAMPVEEATNYILLAYAHWKATGDSGSLAARLPLLKALIGQVAAADLDGDSLPDTGTANTFDDGVASLHLARNQTYLGVKSAAAAEAVLEGMDGLADSDTATADTADRIRHGVAHTLENAAWRGDHFAINLDPSGTLAGDRNGQSIHTPNGLMYLLQFGGNLPLSAQLLSKFKEDAVSSAARTAGPSGSVHTETSSNGWASQSIWRDGVASYLGAALPDLTSAYRDQQVSYARTGDGGWWDVYVYEGATSRSIKPDGRGRHVLGYYPRGAATFGLLQSQGAVSIDRPHGVIGTLRSTGVSVPLYALADWSTGTIPIAGSGGITNPTAATALMAYGDRPASAPAVTAVEVAQPDATVTATGLLTDTVTISAGHAGNWYYGTASPVAGAASATWDGSGGYNASGTACVFERHPSPTLLRTGGCAPLSVNADTPGPSRRWYLAEGSSAWGFSTYVLVQNPNPTPATVTLTYMTASGSVPQAPVILPPNSRQTFNLASALPGTDASTVVDSDIPVVAERSMYWSRDGAFREGHVARGATNPQTEWFLPEGSTAHGFSEYVLVQNPNPQPANVTLAFALEGGGQVTTSLQLPAETRRTVNVATVAPNADLATHITSDQPVVAERAMYWGSPEREGGTDGAGLVAPSRTWYLAEGSSAWGFSTYLLLQNPNAFEVAVNVTYNTASGAVARRGLTMQPNSRQTISLANDVGIADSSIAVQASAPVLAERSMYWSRDGAFHSGHVSDGTPSPSRHWNLAEGTTAYGFSEFVLIQNPGESAATVTLNLQYPTGPPSTVIVGVPAGSRSTFKVNNLTPTPTDVSISVDSTVPVVVERSMYTSSPLGGFSVATDGMGTR